MSSILEVEVRNRNAKFRISPEMGSLEGTVGLPKFASTKLLEGAHASAIVGFSWDVWVSRLQRLFVGQEDFDQGT